MAERYPDYDWRGIAMLTQQLGQLFEPSKAKMMSRQQDHEMNMLMAKQAWKMQSDNLDALMLERKALVTKIDAETEAVNILGGRDLVKAGMFDGALPEETAEVFDKTSLKNLKDMQDADIMHRKAILELENQLSNMKTFNEYGKIGKKFGTDYKGEKGAKNYLEIHDIEPETPGFLSPDERENVKFDALNTMFLVKNVENLKEGTDYMTIYAAGKPVNVRPEAVAFVAGFDTDSAEARLEKTVKAKAAYGKPQQTLDEWLNIDSAWMALSKGEQDKIATALKLPESAKTLSPALKDTYLAMKKRDEIAVKLMGSNLNDRIQPLSDVDFQLEDAPGWGTGDIQKPWVELGLTQEMYSSLRRLGSKGGNTRGAFEHLIRNWEDIDDNLKIAYANQIKLQHSQLVGI